MIEHDFGLRLKELRNKRGLTQEQVADKLGITKSAISEYESNLSYPKVENLIKLALILNSTTDYLLGLKFETLFDFKGLAARQKNCIEDIIKNLTEEFKRANEK